MDRGALEREDEQRVHTKDKQINELSDMVKELLREQQELKNQLDNTGGRPARTGMRKNQVGGLNKRASERVPRKPVANHMSREHIMGPAANKDLELENPRHYLNKPLSNKPMNDGDPKINQRLTAERTKMLDKRRKEQQDKEKEKLDAIETKIENARRRLEEKKKIKSQHAKETVKRRTAPAGHQQHH